MMCSDDTFFQGGAVALVLGRGGRHGSQGIPRKNLTTALGRPILEYPLLAASHARHVSRIFMSTDDEEIASYGRAYGAEIIERPSELATTQALMEDAIAHAANVVTKHYQWAPSCFVILMCNAPCILAETIDAGIALLLRRHDLDSVITASRFNMFHPLRARRLTDQGTLVPFVSSDSFRGAALSSNRDSAGDAYFGDSGMTVVRPNVLEQMDQNLLPCRWMGKAIGVIEQPEGGGDLDAPWQIGALEYWLREAGFTETTTPYSVDTVL